WRSIQPLRRTSDVDAEVVENKTFDLRDRGRRLTQADRQHRHLGIAGGDRAMAAAAGVVAAGDVDELPAGSGRHEHLACVRISQGGLDASEAVRMLLEQREVLVAPAAG